MIIKDTNWRDSVRIIWAITAKDFVEAVKNKNTLTVIITGVLMLLVYRWLPLLESRGEPTNLLVYDPGESALVAFLENSPSVKVYNYPSIDKMKRDLVNGIVPELGLVIPPDFDRTMEAGGEPALTGYVTNWINEEETSRLKGTIEDEITSLVGAPVNIQVEGNIIYPSPDSGGIGVNAGFGFIFIVTMIGLSMIPHLMLEEKHSHTIDALLVSPASEWQIVAAKAVTGLIYCALSSTVAIIIFHQVIVHWWLMMLALLCGSLFTISVGLLLGTLINNRGQLTLLAWVFIIPLLMPIFLSLLDELVPEMLVDFFKVIPTVVTFNLLRASFAGTVSLGLSLLQLIWITALAGCVLLIVAWLVRRRDRETGGFPIFRQLVSKRLSPVMGSGSRMLATFSQNLTRNRLSQGADTLKEDVVPARKHEGQPSLWRSNQSLRIILAIAMKDISSALKNKIVLSILVGTLLVVINGSLLPILLSLRSKPTAIVFDEGRSTIVRALAAQDEFQLRLVDSLEEMEAVVSGAPDARLGLVIPADFDQRTGDNQPIELQGYYVHWADPDKVNRLVSVFEEQLGLAVWGTVRIDTSGNSLYPSLEAVGQVSITSLMMFMVILSIGMALVPLLFVEEKEAHTMDALLISPATMRQVVIGKAMAGALYCLVGATIVILINRYLIVHWGAMLLAVLLGAAFTVALGLVVGIKAENPASTGMWGGLLIVLLMGLTFLETFQISDWPMLVEEILELQPGSAIMRLFQISMSGEIPPGLLWTNVLSLLTAAILIYAVVFGMLRRVDR